jgi:peptide/nickel transport system substrate-binding protein
MKLMRTRTARGMVIAAAAGSLVLTAGCSGGSNNNKAKTASDKQAAAQSQPVSYGDQADSKGPAAPVEGARKGGTINVYQQADFSHLDPGQSYVSDAGLLGRLIDRGLTQYKEGPNGKKTVVGDIATDSGEKSDGGKTWTYHLKDGIKDAKGHTITAEDVRHTFERLYAPFITDGPTYIQQWLSGDGTTYRKALPHGDFKGDHLPKNVLATPDDHTVVFHFKKPRPDLPQALTMVGYAIVPKEDDTKEKYDSKPVCLGPYKIGKFEQGKEMQLVRNKYWDPKTDSVRHQYVDGFNIQFNHDDDDQTQRILADQGDAKDAIQFTGSVASSKIRNVIQQASDRTIKGYQPYVWQLNFNMNRIKDKKVRDAITYALPNKNIIRPAGGAYAGKIAGGLLAPTLPGYDKSYDPFGKYKHPNGQPDKAKKLLKESGKVGKKLVYAYSNTPKYQKQSIIIANALEKVGFKVERKEVNSSTWYEQMGKVKNGFDIYMTGWGQDWPSASTVIPPSFDGRNIQDGASNYAHLNNQHVNKEIDRIGTITDPKKATAAWTKLAHYISEKINPAAPIYDTKQLQIYGSNIGGARYSSVTSYIDVTRLYLKK